MSFRTFALVAISCLVGLVSSVHAKRTSPAPHINADQCGVGRMREITTYDSGRPSVEKCIDDPNYKKPVVKSFKLPSKPVSVKNKKQVTGVCGSKVYIVERSNRHVFYCTFGQELTHDVSIGAVKVAGSATIVSVNQFGSKKAIALTRDQKGNIVIEVPKDGAQAVTVVYDQNVTIDRLKRGE